MKQIEKWLQDNNITYRLAKWGNPVYFDGFCISGLQVTFDFYLDPNARTKIAIFERYMRRKRTYDCKCHKYSAGWWYRVLSTTDAAKTEVYAVHRTISLFQPGSRCGNLRIDN